MNDTSNDWKLFTRFYTYIRPYWRWVALSLFTIPIATVGSLAFPWLLIRIIDEYLVAKKEGLEMMVLLLSVILVLTYLADAIYSYYLQKAGHRAILDMRTDLFGRVLNLPRRYFDRRPIGVTLTRLTTDIEAIGESFASGVIGMLTDFIKTISLLLFLFYLSWKLTLVVLLVGPVMYVIVKFLRKKLREMYDLSRTSLAEAAGFLQECLNGMKTVQLYAAENEVFQRFEKLNQRFFVAQCKSNNYDSILFSIIEGITSITVGLVIWYGSGQVLAGVVTIGVLIGFINTLNKIFIPIREFTQQISGIQRALAAFEHIDELFNEPVEEENLKALEENPSLSKDLEDIVFDNVSFRYKEDGPYILKEVSFSMKQGERVALVGSTGSGKSTIIRILTKVYGGYEGSIRVNGVELSEIPTEKINQWFSLMQQDVYLFDESMEFNIALGREGITLEKVKESAKFVYAHSFIEQFAEQYNFQVQDNGANLSAGQAQLVSFARSIAGGNEMIILDEATSAVDSVTENLIQKAIEKIFQNKTVIAIAHRLSTIQGSDLILVLDNGQIVERGDHESLLEMEGFYANLVNQLESLETV